MNYYERHLGDYARDTGHLSMLEHGAYTLLLDRCYASESGIPADQAHRIARARSREERSAVDAVLAEFFVLVDGIWIQQRVIEEIEKAHRRIGAAQSNGRTGGRPRRKPSDNPEQTQQKPTGLLLGSISETQQKALQSPDSRLQTPDPVDTSPRPLCVSAATSRADTRAHARAPWNPIAAHQIPQSPAVTDPGVLPESAHHAAFARLQAAYPPCAGRKDWLTAEHHCRRLVAEGATWEALAAGVERYRAFVAAGGVSSTAYVLTPVKFFADADRPWAQPWDPPQATNAVASVVPLRMRKTVAEYEAECPGSTL